MSSKTDNRKQDGTSVSIRTQSEEEKFWYAPQGLRVICPVPGCGHIGSLISKVHCRMHHNMERHEVGERYGKPKSIRVEQKWGW